MTENKSGSLKRVEAFIKVEKTHAVMDALQAKGIQATFFESKGIGKGEKYRLSYGRGAGQATQMSYSERHTVVIITEVEKVREIVDIIKSTATTGTSGGGIIVISPADEIVAL